MLRPALLAGLHAVYLAWLWALATGAPWLERVLPGGLPLGNLLTALALAALPAAAVLFAPPGQWARRFSTVVALLGLAWLPVSVALAGNLDLDFGDSIGGAWLVWSLGVVLLGWLAYLWSLTARLLATRRTAP